MSRYIAIVGSPEFSNLDALRDYVEGLDPDIVVVCSDGGGFHAKVREVASTLNRAIKVVPDERRFGDVSSVRCAEQITRKVEALVAFSVGTYGWFLYYVALAEEAGLPIRVIDLDGRQRSVETLRKLLNDYDIAENLAVGRARAEGEARAQARPGAVKIDFYVTDVGWILFSVIHNETIVRISAECLWDPFPDMIEWLEAVADNARPAHFDMTARGWTHRFVARPVDQETFHFLLLGFDDGENEPDESAVCEYISAQISKAGFIREFYGEFRAYVTTRHDPNEWMSRTYEDRLRDHRPDFGLADLQGMTRQELVRFWQEEGIEWLRFRSPDDWRFWSEDELRAYIQEMLEDEFRNWGGEDLSALVSPKLEALLSR